MDHDLKFELPPNTMLIKPSAPEQGPFVIINVSDFDKKTMEEYIPPRKTVKKDGDEGEGSGGETTVGNKTKGKKS